VGEEKEPEAVLLRRDAKALRASQSNTANSQAVQVQPVSRLFRQTQPYHRGLNQPYHRGGFSRTACQFFPSPAACKCLEKTAIISGKLGEKKNALKNTLI